MLDKGQIKDWDGEPEKAPEGKTPEAKAPQASVTPPAPEPRKDIGAMIMEAREAVPTGERVILTPEQATARKRRGQWLALALFSFVIIVFVLTMNKVGSGMGLPEVYKGG